MNSSWSRIRKYVQAPILTRLCTSALLAFGASFLIAEARAQNVDPDAAPPPLKIISKEEQTKLDTKTDVKDRTRISLDLMKIRLAGAEKMAAAQDFDGMYRELGTFNALMDDALTFLNKRDDGRGRVLDAFKRIGITLRGMAPRIEVMRRELPIKYDPYVRRLMGYLRSARDKATDSLFDDSVLPNKKPGN